MKNIIKTAIFALLIVGFISCEDSKDPMVSANGFELRKDPTVISPAVLTSAISTDAFAKFEWDKSNNGPATVASYTLQLFDHNDTSLANPVEYSGSGLIVTPSLRTATLTVLEFNNLINALPTYKCSEMDIDVRIKSTLGTNPATAFIQYSNPINVKVTGYSLKLPLLAFVKDGNTASTEPRIAASAPSSNSDYEGYMYLEPGNYKFYKPDACRDFTSAVVYGGTAGVLDTSATPAGIVISAAGHYLVKANLAAATYSLNEYRAFGLYGKAKSTLGFSNAFVMTDSNDNKWTLTVDLYKGRKFKFKSNLWTGPTTGTPATVPTTATIISALGKSTVAGQLVQVNTGADDAAANAQGFITVPGTNDGTKSSCLITIDVSNPREYTYILKIL